MKRFTQIFILVTGLILFFGSVFSVKASDRLQTFTTPTPGPDGRIVYIVKEGQNCSMIATLAGIPLSQLRSLNSLDENCTIRPGEQLLLGIASPPGGTATPTEAAATATPLRVTLTPAQGDATVCVLLYNDLNGDGLHQDTESSIAAGAVSVTGTSGQYSQSKNTTADDLPVCFEKVLAGLYNISVAAPEGYNPTTQQNFTIDIKSGEQIYVDFGAQVAAKAKPLDSSGEPGSINFLAIFGGILILLALGLGVYAWLAYGKKARY